MTSIYFLIRHTPFWSIPLMVIALEFGYVYWLKQKRAIFLVNMGVAGFCFLMTCYYYWAGGPEKAVHRIVRFLQ